MRRRLALLAATLAGLLAAGPLSAQSVSVTVDGIAREVPVLERQGHRFVALDRIADLLGGRVVSAGAERAVLAVDEDVLEVRRRIPYVGFAGRWYQMPLAAQKDDRGYWLPATSLRHLLPELWPGRFAPQAPAPPAEEERERPRPGGVESGTIGDLEAIDVWSGPGRTRLGLRLERTPGVSVDATLPGALELHLSGVAVPPSVSRGLRDVGLVDSVAVASTDDGSALTLWLAPDASTWSVAPLRSPAGVEVVLLTAAADEVPALLAADLAGPSARSEASREPTRRSEGEPVASRDPVPVSPRPAPDPPRRGEVWRIVVDPGHGGHDPGASGPGGTREKDVVLAIGKALKSALESREGVEVILTRDEDAFVKLGERTRMANDQRADLFVSIHANAAENPAAEGFETYFLSAAKTEDARRVARMENAAIRYENPEIDPASLDDLNFILWDLAQNEYLRESSVLAETIQRELDRRLSLESRGVKQAPFYVLNGAFMPAILFETAFITNPREESLLNDAAFRSRLVDGLAESIVTYLERRSRKGALPTATR
ncbi:MAG: N-acetylmuramoyl-L-alanine amidase [Gemmatimonadota bacterium]|nr:N-acetylmuramoyl-L-alanine amidase [Gemmatimonadota bacterium]